MTSRADTIRALLAKDPADVFLHYSLGMELLGAGEPLAAAAAFERCIELDAAYLPAYVEAGKALRTAGRRDQARQRFEQAMAVARTANDNHMVNYVRQQLEGLG